MMLGQSLLTHHGGNR